MVLASSVLSSRFVEENPLADTHRDQTDTVRLDLVRVRLWLQPDDREVWHFRVPADQAKLLAEFVRTGRVVPKIRQGLQASLNRFPAWEKCSIDSDLSSEQRQSIAGDFVLANGRRVELEYDLDLQVSGY